MHTVLSTKLPWSSITECVLLAKFLLFFLPQRLWRLIVEEFHLINQLKVIKDFFLMGRGELYLAFIDKAEDILLRTPISTTEYGKGRQLCAPHMLSVVFL